MADLLSSKITISEEEPKLRTFPTYATAVLGIMGVTERGPLRTPQLVTSYEEFEQVYGGFISGRQCALAVRAFFLNGGKQCYVSRVAHYGTHSASVATSDATTGTQTLQTAAGAASPAVLTGTVAGPWKMTPNDTLIASIDGAGDDTATFDATAAARENATAETYVLVDQQTLTVKVDAETTAQTITFDTAEFVDIGAATAEEVAQAINNEIVGATATVTSSGTKVTITSDRKGTGSKIEVTGGTANTALGFATAQVSGASTAGISDIDAVTTAEMDTILTAAFTGGGGVSVTFTASKIVITTVATGASASVEVKATSSAETILGLSTTIVNGSAGSAVNTLKVDGKTPGAYINTIKPRIYAASSGLASEFNLQVLDGTVVLETWTNLTMATSATTATAERFAETIINDASKGSDYIAVTDQAAAGSATNRRPADTSGAALTGGGDGLTGLTDTDFTGYKGAESGVYAFDNVSDITLMCAPDRPTATTMDKLLYYCGHADERQGMVFAILDTSEDRSTGALAKTFKAGLSNTAYFENGAMYWPWVKIINPSNTVYGKATKSINMAPSGVVAGIMAARDSGEDEGPFYQPAGVEAGKPVGVVALEDEDGTPGNNHKARLEAHRNLVFPDRINPITFMKGYGVFVDGARTLKGDGNFPSVGERRGVSHIERLLEAGLQWVRHRNNTPDLREDIESQVYALLYEWMQKGAFATRDPDTAFFVDVSDALNPPSVVREGKVVMRVGLATNTPAEFIVIKVTKDTRALSEELFGQI